MSRKLAIVVGNGRIERDVSEMVDSADFVMRFNEPKLAGGWSGTRTDILVLSVSSKQFQKRLAEPAFLENAAVKAAREVMLAYHPVIIRKYHPRPNFLQRLKGRRADWTDRAIEIMHSAGKEVRVMPPQFYLDGCAELRIPQQKMRELFPSTGFLGIGYVLDRFSTPEWDVKLCGFTWEGWKRHPWHEERAWVEDKIENSRLNMIG
ncbi:glycosyltransferase family 29 protein [Rhizobium sp. IMFF44]|uniref:glycosyltransferase family 29 protein n=1 Tax=Rhizobium sp. IMFF44 TaxID=3342350 RepID=UPI0035B6BF09